MTIRLSKDLEQFVHDVVRAGRYASQDAVLADALERLREQTPGSLASTETVPTRQAGVSEASLSPDALAFCQKKSSSPSWPWPSRRPRSISRS